MKVFNNEKGFTVIELVLSFAFVMFLAIAMFAVVNSYRSREQKEAINRELLTLKSTLTQDIYEDTLNRKVDKIEYCLDEEGEIVEQCINIDFLDGTTKQLSVVNESVTTNEDGTTFTYDTFSIIYGNVKYNNPDPKFAKIVSDYILTYTTELDNLEYGVLYKIRIRIDHQDIEEEFVIEVVTTGIN